METKQIISWLYDKAARAQDHSYARMLNMIAKRVRELDEKQRWIPVTERLPKPGTRVLVCIGAVFEAFIDDAGIWQRYNFEPLNDVLGQPTHWMPLPEPPKED